MTLWKKRSIIMAIYLRNDFIISASRRVLGDGGGDAVGMGVED